MTTNNFPGKIKVLTVRFWFKEEFSEQSLRRRSPGGPGSKWCGSRPCCLSSMSTGTLLYQWLIASLQTDALTVCPFLGPALQIASSGLRWPVVTYSSWSIICWNAVFQQTWQYGSGMDVWGENLEKSFLIWKYGHKLLFTLSSGVGKIAAIWFSWRSGHHDTGTCLLWWI